MPVYGSQFRLIDLGCERSLAECVSFMAIQARLLEGLAAAGQVSGRGPRYRVRLGLVKFGSLAQGQPVIQTGATIFLLMQNKRQVSIEVAVRYI